jgi:hypothetical protein
MQVLSCAEAQTALPALLNRALSERIAIKNGDYTFRLLPLRTERVRKSPFDGVPCLKTRISTDEIVSAIREGRAEG